MAVYNGGSSLTATIDSVLAQEQVNLEFIIVNDGSTDLTRSVLDDYARRDRRLRVMHRTNRGLTVSLIEACASAQGVYIARQDAGDVSLPDRLQHQQAQLDEDPNAAMTTCGTRFVGPRGEFLYEARQDTSDLQAGLAKLNLKEVRGPSHHGSVLFRRKAYEIAGGYRNAFQVAQDIDLWMRLFENGSCLASPAVLYEASVTRGTISQTLRKAQIQTAECILECAAQRRLGLSDDVVISRWVERKRLSTRKSPTRRDDARFYYHLGCLLRASDPVSARHYFVQAVRHWLPYPAAWYRLAETRVRP